jgi:hypothetical protein
MALVAIIDAQTKCPHTQEEATLKSPWWKKTKK